MIPKYRIWHKGRKQMFMVSTIDFRQEKISYIDGSGFAGAFISFDDVILMQSTGLHDKNGVEIFEGDLLIHEANIFTVEWIRLGFIPVRKCEFGYERLSGYLMTEAIRIGNIHQNPELIENEAKNDD